MEVAAAVAVDFAPPADDVGVPSPEPPHDESIAAMASASAAAMILASRVVFIRLNFPVAEVRGGLSALT